MKRRQFLTSLSGAASVAALGTPAAMAAAAARPLYKDPAAPVPARVKDLLGRMTLEEKVAQMLCIWQEKGIIQDANGEFSAAKASTDPATGQKALDYIAQIDKIFWETKKA